MATAYYDKDDQILNALLHNLSTCNFCQGNTSSEDVKCFTCLSVAYCSIDCKRKDLKFHRVQCKPLVDESKDRRTETASEDSYDSYDSDCSYYTGSSDESDSDGEKRDNQKQLSSEGSNLIKSGNQKENADKLQTNEAKKSFRKSSRKSFRRKNPKRMSSNAVEGQTVGKKEDSVQVSGKEDSSDPKMDSLNNKIQALKVKYASERTNSELSVHAYTYDSESPCAYLTEDYKKSMHSDDEGSENAFQIDRHVDQSFISTQSSSFVRTRENSRRIVKSQSSFIGLKVKDDPAFARFFKLRKMNFSDKVIQDKMRSAGVDPALLNQPDAVSPNQYYSFEKDGDCSYVCPPEQSFHGKNKDDVILPPRIIVESNQSDSAVPGYGMEAIREKQSPSFDVSQFSRPTESDDEFFELEMNLHRVSPVSSARESQRSSSLYEGIDGQRVSVSRYSKKCRRQSAKYNVVWEDKHLISNCAVCQTKFSRVRLNSSAQKHHCRLCGKVICGKCSKSRAVIQRENGDRKEKRVCKLCAAIVDPEQIVR